MSTHQIEQGETLSQLAKFYNTDVATLQALNSEQIKNIDLIYDGNTLKIPEVPDTKTGQREVKEELPNDKLAFAECKIPKYIDALYVPEDPNTQKQMLVLLTEEAKKHVISDNDRCKNALSGTKEDILKNLTKLGVMDQFNSITHEAFLALIDAQKVTSYRQALLEKYALKFSYAEKTLAFPLDNGAIGLSNIKGNINNIESQYQSEISNIELESNGTNLIPVKNMHGEVMLKQDAISNAKALRIKRLEKLQLSLIDDLTDVIKDFEDEAIEYATSVKIADGSDTYVFSKEHDYYSTQTELKVHEALATIKRERPSTNMDDSLQSADLTNSSEIMSLDKAHEFYEYWQSHAHGVLQRLNAQQIEWNPTSFFASNSENNIKERSFFSALYRLNQSQVLIKEQCLTKDELFKGWEQVQAIREKIEEVAPSITEIEKNLDRLNNKVSLEKKLGYYSAYVLNLVLLKEISKRSKNFTRLLGEYQHYKTYINRLFIYAEMSKKRCDSLLDLAKTKTDNPVTYYKKNTMTYMSNSGSDNERFVITNEGQWKPQNLDRQIFIQNGLNKRTVVECALSSNPNDTLYILSDSPVLSKDLAENKKCTSLFNLNLSTSAGRSKENLRTALKQAIGGSTEALVSSLEFSETVNATNLPDIIFPWCREEFKSETFGITAMVETSGGAQFARFACSAKSEINGETIGNEKATLNAEFTAEFSAASAEQTITMRIPATGEQPLNIPYIVSGEDPSVRVQNVGSTVIEINGKIYGVLAASVKVGTQVHIGNMEDAETAENREFDLPPLGIKGTVPNAGDFSSFKVKTYRESGDNPTQIAASFNAEASAFAGIEAGGVLSCKLDWKKDQKSAMQNLFKVASGFKMSAGVGINGVFQCTFQNNRFIFITALGASAGLGFGGKLATELNPRSADDFFEAILDVMRIPGFKKFAFFDESNGSATYAAFNTVITVAAAYGLTIGQTLLLPFNIISDMEERATNKETAYFVANFILSKEHQEVNKQWISKMPAETLAKLLTVLINYNEFPYFGDDSKARAASRNQNQRKAILQILNWLGGASPSKEQIHRFENAVQRMRLKDPTKLEKSVQWQSYANNIAKLNNFFTQALSDEYEYPMGIRPTKETKPYMTILQDDIGFFNMYMSELTSNRVVLEKRLSNSDYRKNQMVKYVSAESKDQSTLEKQGYHIIEW